MTQEELDALEISFKYHGFTWNQTNFAVAVIRSHVETLRQQLAERDAELKRINLAINDDRVDLTITAAEAITELWQQVAELTLSSDTYFIERNSARDAWRRVSKERDELRQQVTLLREAMQGAWKDGYCFVGPEGQTDEQKVFEQALATIKEQGI